MGMEKEPSPQNDLTSSSPANPAEAVGSDESSTDFWGEVTYKGLPSPSSVDPAVDQFVVGKGPVASLFCPSCENGLMTAAFDSNGHQSFTPTNQFQAEADQQQKWGSRPGSALFLRLNGTANPHFQHAINNTIISDALSSEPVKSGKYKTGGTDSSPRRQVTNDLGQNFDCWQVVLKNCLDESDVVVFSQSVWPPGDYVTGSDLMQLNSSNNMVESDTGEREPMDFWMQMKEILGFKLPAQSPDDARRIEECLKECPDFYKIFLKYLSRLGGKDHKQCFSRIMVAIITKKACEQFSWAGQRDGKIAFKEFGLLLTVVYDAVLAGARSNDWKLFELETCIKAYLRRCQPTQPVVKVPKKKMMGDETPGRLEPIQTDEGTVNKIEKIKTSRIASSISTKVQGNRANHFY